MKVGEYARTKNCNMPSLIGKIIKEEYITPCNAEHKYIYLIDVKDNNVWFEEDNILKSNPNIIDLLQPMDLMYIDISPDNCGGIVVPRIPETYCELEQIINEIKLGNYVLNGIVTKEQLMENMYKVESEVN